MADREEDPTAFSLVVNGQIELAEVEGSRSGYCKFLITHGEDWQVLDGLEEGVTQLSKRAPGIDTSFVWNFPINVAYRSTNIFGWPQLVLSVYDVDNLGRDIVLGYGSTHIPTAPGNYNLKVRLYKPMASSILQHLTSWITRVQPEFVDPKFPTQTEGREVVRAQSSGHAIATVNVMTRNMEHFGYNTGRQSKADGLIHVQV